MTDFGRRFPGPWMALLKERPAWWQDVLEYRFKDVGGAQQQLFLAVRDGYLNAYVEGQSVLKVKFDKAAKLRAKIHHKYLDDAAVGQAYKVFDGSAVNGTPYKGKETLQEWVERAQRYSRHKNVGMTGSEKQGVAVIAGRNSHVIDVEMGLPGPTADRIDIVALERDGAAVKIVFYEAKLFNNPALRAKNFEPKVLGQIDRYIKWLTSEGREEQVKQAYRETCKLLIELREMQGATPLHKLVVEASKDGSNLQVDPEPRLLAFGFEESRTNHYWEPHEKVLRGAGIDRARLIMQPRAEDVKIPESTPLDAAPPLGE